MVFSAVHLDMVFLPVYFGLVGGFGRGGGGGRTIEMWDSIMGINTVSPLINQCYCMNVVSEDIPDRSVYNGGVVEEKL